MRALGLTPGPPDQLSSITLARPVSFNDSAVAHELVIVPCAVNKEDVGGVVTSRVTQLH